VFRSWLAIFVATVGFIGSLVVFIPEFSLDGTYSKVMTLAVCFFLSVIVTLISKPMSEVVENLKIEDIVFDVNSSSRILFPYEEKLLKPINAIANSYYGSINPDQATIKAWYEKNPCVLVALADKNNSIVGYYDILPLVDSFAKEFIDGKACESDIRAEHILPPRQMKNAKYIYFAGVAVKDYDNQRNRIYSGQLLYSVFIYLGHFYDLENEIEMLALASSRSGERILKKLGYVLENSRYNRSDKTDLYSKVINRRIVEHDRERLALITNKIDYKNLFVPQF